MRLVIPSDLTWFGLVFAAVYALLFRLVAGTTDDLGKAIAQAVSDALHSAHIAPKVVASCWGCSVTRVYQVLDGDPTAPVTIAKLLRLPFMFWTFFAPWLFARIAQQRMRELVGE